MSIAVTGSGAIPTSIINFIQDRTLERMFHDGLYPRLLWRSEAVPELWQANLGERMAFTRAGRMAVSTTPLTPGVDPTAGSYDMEQWEATASQFAGTIDTSMPSSYVAAASTFLRSTQQLGLNAGETINRLVRNNVFNAYAGGETAVTAAVASGVSIPVASLAGFRFALLNGKPQAVASGNPIAVTFSNGITANTVIGATPTSGTNPDGPGTLTLGTAISGAIAAPTSTARVAIFAGTRARRVRPGAATTIDGLTGSNILTYQNILDATAYLRSMNVPPTADGTYHVHMEPAAEAEVFAGSDFQRIFQSLPDSLQHRDFAIGRLAGSTFYRDTENPNGLNVGSLIDTSGGSYFARAGTDFHGDVINQAGVPIMRTIIVGGGAVYEKYLDESKFISEAGVTGKIGEFTVTNNGVSIMTSRIRYTLRSPLDRLQQMVTQTWSWSGDFPIPSDASSGNTALYKRAVIIEHA